MSRTLVDVELNRWEVFATTGPHGYSDPARLLFRCLSDRDVRSRALPVEGGKAEAEHVASTATTEELSKMLSRAEAID